MAQPGGDSPLGSPRIAYSNERDRRRSEPGRLATIRDDINVNGDDEDTRAKCVTDLINQSTVLGRDVFSHPDTHQRLINALDATFPIPQHHPRPRSPDQNPFGGMNEFMAPTFGGLDQTDEEDRRRSYLLENQDYRNGLRE